MVARRRTFYKRRRSYKKRTMNISRPKMGLRSGSKVMFLKRTFRALTWTPDTASTAGFWRNPGYTLNTMPSATDVTNLFDQYKINGVKVTFRPRYDNFAGNDTTDTTAPGVTNQGTCDVHCIVDPYCQLTPSGTYTNTNLNVFLENGKVRTFSGTKPFSIFVKPTVDLDIAGITGARRGRSWVSTLQGGITHYGAQFFVADPGLTGNFNQAWDVYFTYYIACRGIK